MSLIKRLLDDANRLTGYDDSYYNHGIKKISDAEYDLLKKDFIATFKSLPDDQSESYRILSEACNKIGAKPETASGSLIAHSKRMLSIQPTFSHEEANTALYRILELLKGENELDNEFIVEYKHDGVAATIKFGPEGIIEGYTRGDGIYGERIHHLKSKIGDNLTYLHLDWVTEPCEIRGELVVSKACFKALVGKSKPLTNELSAAVGIVKTHKDLPEYRDTLTFIPYSYIGPKNFGSQLKFLNMISSGGAPWVSEFKLTKETFIGGVDDLTKILVRLEEESEDYPYPVDGTVIKVNSYTLADKLAPTERHPTSMFSYKFAALTNVTKVANVKYTVAASGCVTPVLLVDNVSIRRKQINKLSLFSCDWLKKNPVAIGDMIEVKLAGGCAPVFNRLVRNMGGSKIELPSECPCCKSPLTWVGKNLFCQNDKCEERILRKLAYFRKCNKLPHSLMTMNNLKPLVEFGGVCNPYELFTVSPAVIDLVLDGWWCDDIDAHRKDILAKLSKTPVELLLPSLSIPKLTRKVALQIGADKEYPNCFVKGTAPKKYAQYFTDDWVIKLLKLIYS